MRKHALVLSAFSAVALLSSAAFAKQHQWACSDAVKQYCADIQPGGGRVLDCLKSHESNLSPDCLAASQKAAAHHEAFETACGNDISTICKDQDTGHGMLWKCLKTNENQLSASCKAFTAKAHQDMMQHQE